MSPMNILSRSGIFLISVGAAMISRHGVQRRLLADIDDLNMILAISFV
jgi:hypothetical protein